MIKSKCILTLSIIMLFQLAYSQKQAIRVQYLLSYKIDSTNVNKVDEEIMYLDIIPNQKSIFLSETRFLSDSILQSSNPQNVFGLAKPKFNYAIEKLNGIETQNIYYNYTSFKYLVEDQIHLNWKIRNNAEKEILGYKCKLAETSFRGRDYKAWFTDEIMIPDGPYKFNGLPGLILEIYDTKNHYNFEALGIHKLNSYINFLDKDDYTQINKNEFKQFLKKIKQKPSLILNNPGIQIPQAGLDKYDRNHRKRNKSKNNPIELN